MSDQAESSHDKEFYAALAGGQLGAVLPTTINETFSISLNLQSVTSDLITISYSTPNGNDPVANQNYLYVFQTQGPNIPIGAAPIASAAAGVGGAVISPSGSANFGANPYVIAYSVGPSVQVGTTNPVTTWPNIAATTYTPQGAGTPLGPPSNTPITVAATLSITSASTQNIAFSWTVPPGINPTKPAGAGAWIGVWNSQQAPYATPPMAYAPIMRANQTGTTAVTGLNLSANAPYTAALFTSGYSSNPANLSTGNIAYYMYFTTSASI